MWDCCEEDFIQVGVNPTDACILVKGGETHHPQEVYIILGDRKKLKQISVLKKIFKEKCKDSKVDY